MEPTAAVAAVIVAFILAGAAVAVAVFVLARRDATSRADTLRRELYNLQELNLDLTHKLAGERERHRHTVDHLADVLDAAVNGPADEVRGAVLSALGHAAGMDGSGVITYVELVLDIGDLAKARPATPADTAAATENPACLEPATAT
jgi:hypothetical protein